MVNGIIKTKERKGKKVEQGAPIKKEKNRRKGIKGMNGITMKTK